MFSTEDSPDLELRVYKCLVTRICPRFLEDVFSSLRGRPREGSHDVSGSVLGGGSSRWGLCGGFTAATSGNTAKENEAE